MYECPDCGSTYDAPGPWRCGCGHALEYETSPGPATTEPPGEQRPAWAPFLPVAHPVSLGEGWTPAVDVPGIDATVTLEYCSPTASFKDRGAATLLGQARELGVERVLEDSSGNAGLAVATYAARADVDARIYVPADASPGALAAIERTGADLRRIDGDRAAVTEACVGAVEAGEGWYASHAWHPAFLAGTATLAYEVAARRDWTVPDVAVVPVGHGTLLLGLARGFRALRAAGWTDAVPRLLAVQPRGVAPLVADGDGPVNDLAAGIQIREPARGDQIDAALDRTAGTALAVSREATADARDRLAELGFHVAPTSATALAGLALARDRGLVAPSADVLVPLTGSGLTT